MAHSMTHRLRHYQSIFSQFCFNASTTSNIMRLEVPREKKLLIEEVTTESQYDALKAWVSPLSHLPYADQLKMKQDWVAYVVSQYVKIFDERCSLLGRKKRAINPSIKEICASPVIERYRNKDTYVVRPGVDENPKTVGHIVGNPSQSKTKHVCVPPVDTISPLKHIEVAKAYQEYIRMSPLPACHHFDIGGVWKGICVRSNSKGDLMALVDVNPKGLTQEQLEDEKSKITEFFVNGPGSRCELTSLYFQGCPHTRCSSKQAPLQLLHGEPYMFESLNGYNFALSPTSFFQVNKEMAAVLYKHVLSAAKLSSLTTLLDLCCGIGVISILASSYVRGAVGIDICEDSVNDAKRNIHLNNINSVRFLEGRVELMLEKALEDLSLSGDVVAILNPGRGGVYKNVIETLRKTPQIRTLIYVSCQPDHKFVVENMIKLLIPSGKRDLGPHFHLNNVVPLDMFPQTSHCEVIFCFHR